MANQANIKAVITAEDKASNVLKGFGGNVTKLGAVAGAVAGVVSNVFNRAVDAMADSVQGAVKRIDTLNNSTRTFDNMGFAAGDVKVAMKELDQSIRGLPTSLDEAVRGVTLIASATNDVGKARKIFTALNDAILGFGGTSEMVSTAVQQLSQDLAGGRIQAETWNSMLDSGLGPTLAAIARQMGITTRDLKTGLSTGAISVEKFTDMLIQMDEKGGGGIKSLQQIAKDSTKGIGTSFENMKTAIERGMANILNAIGTENIAKAITNIGTLFEGVTKKVGEVLPGAIENIKEFGRQAAEYLSPKLQELATVVNEKVMPPLKELWEDVLKPLVPLVGTTLVFAVGLFIDSLKILAGWFGHLYTLYKDNLAPSLGALRDTILKDLVPAFKQMWPQLEKVVGLLGAIAKISLMGIVTGVWLLVNAVNAAIQFVSELGRRFDRLPSLVKGAIKGIAPVLHLGGFAEGGFTGRGADNEVAGVVHRGEYVLPKSAVDQSTGMPKVQTSGGGAPVNVTVNMGVFAGSDIEMRKLSEKILQSLRDVASSRGQTVGEML